MSAKIAVVTGSNKGIGFAIVKELLKRKVGVVYLTSRDLRRGNDAVEKLKKEGLDPELHQLDVTDSESVKSLCKFLKQKHGGIDILINNAGVIVKDLHRTTFDDAKYVIDVNYRSHLIIKEHLFPALKENARVINISSDSGHLGHLQNKYWLERLTKKDIKVDDIDAFVEWFLNSVKNETLRKEDFTDTFMLAYKISKIALCALTIVEQNEIGRNISVNSLHPGFVETDMTHHHGSLTVEESSKTPVYMALDAPQSLKGSYLFYDGKVVDWADKEVLKNYPCEGNAKDAYDKKQQTNKPTNTFAFVKL